MTQLCSAVVDALNVSRETLEHLKTYVSLVEQWNPRINLVSRTSLTQIWDRHILDSVQVFRCAPQGKTWVDLGSGGGFPGVVCAILAKEAAPDTEFIMVESDQRKSAFLRTVIRETDTNCRVVSKRIEAVEPLRADILSARALAELSALLSFCDRHLDRSGTALLPKGANWKKELTKAQEEWKFVADPIKSITEPQAVILKITGVARG